MDKEEILESLNPDERVILPYLESNSIKELKEKTGLDDIKIIRSLQFLENKGVIKLKTDNKKVVDLGKNGVIYLKNGLPERRLINLLAENTEISLEDAKKKSGLNDNEFKIALGTLKRKAQADLKEGKIVLNASKEEIAKKSLEEQFLEALPLNYDSLSPEQKHSFEKLKSRKEIIEVKESKIINFEITKLGKELLKEDIEKLKDMIETLTPEMIVKEGWKGKKFRKYDIKSSVPKIYGGKRHFVNQAIDYARKVWTDLGFKEMTGTITQTGFWNFDALFTAQDHPVREMQDTFYIKDVKGKLPEKRLVQEVRKAHECGVGESCGWNYKWDENEPKKVILRTHTTSISAHMLSKIKELKDKKGKYFAIGKCFRNETIDWSHGFEFNQTEGIVVDPSANFKHLLGYLKEFFKKMGFEKIRFRPSYFPYTEPSVEIDVYYKEKKMWLELGGAGMFRPELTIPLLGKHIPVLAWGPGFDRMIMDYYQIKDLREMYKNDLKHLRKIKMWLK